MELTQQEKDDLLAIIDVLIGADTSVIVRKSAFNERTVEVVERVAEEVTECNDSVKALLSDLVGGGRLLVKGKLRHLLGKLSRRLEDDKLRLNGLACRNGTKYKWQGEIIRSTYW